MTTDPRLLDFNHQILDANPPTRIAYQSPPTHPLSEHPALVDHVPRSIPTHNHHSGGSHSNQSYKSVVFYCYNSRENSKNRTSLELFRKWLLKFLI